MLVFFERTVASAFTICAGQSQKGLLVEGNRSNGPSLLVGNSLFPIVLQGEAVAPWMEQGCVPVSNFQVEQLNMKKWRLSSSCLPPNPNRAVIHLKGDGSYNTTISFCGDLFGFSQRKLESKEFWPILPGMVLNSGTARFSMPQGVVKEKLMLVAPGKVFTTISMDSNSCKTPLFYHVFDGNRVISCKPEHREIAVDFNAAIRV